MAEELKALIEKLKKEGVEAAENEARQIRDRAQTEARQTVSRAQADAQALLEDARRRIAREKEAAETTLRQSGRDLILSLRKEIDRVLETIVLQNLQAALTPEELSRLIRLAVEQYGHKDPSVTVSLNPADAARLEKTFLSKLGEELKKSIVLKPSQEQTAGFIISFDEGKSHFDFSDKALTGYLLETLRTRLAKTALENIT